MASTALDLRNRDALFDALGAGPFDMAVIGGGITGAGIARDAALRGLSVALVEAGDFASGTSSRSSKMIHGGLRYLAQGDLALVREAASERKIVQAIAPHLALETPFVIPARNAGAVAKLRAGLWTFEKLGGVPKSRSHEVWSLADLRDLEPAINTEGLAGAVVYPEYLTNDARLTLANVRSAVAAGAVAVNYARADGFVFDGERAVGLEVADQTPGANGRRAHLTAKVIVNAAGPWVDAVRALESGAAQARLSLSRGVHLVVPRARAPVGRTLITPANDRRGVFVVPRGEAAYVGTTDTFYPDPSAWPPVTREDVSYLLDAVNARLATPLDAGDIVATWSGVRPLVGEAGKKASEISRRDEVWTGPAGVISIAGGKLTAYRRMAERVVDRAEAELGRGSTPCRTAREPLPGGDADPAAVRAALMAQGLESADADRLAGLFGSEAAAVGAGGAAAEAAWAVTQEGALTLEDYWVRRSARAWFDPDGGLAALAQAAAAMGPLLGWSKDRADAEISACRRRRETDLAGLTRAAIQA